jgi:hypothetical protein
MTEAQIQVVQILEACRAYELQFSSQAQQLLISEFPVAPPGGSANQA